eukprot:363257-Chlamydomonas_euryale.AAC.11
MRPLLGRVPTSTPPPPDTLADQTMPPDDGRADPVPGHALGIRVMASGAFVCSGAEFAFGIRRSQVAAAKAEARIQSCGP